MPHHMEDFERQIPYSPGYARGGGMVKFRIDWYIIVLEK
jgi:hypothetical protein